MFESENMATLALISFNFFFNNLLDEDLENIVAVWARSLEELLFNQLYVITNTHFFNCFCV